MLNTRPRKKHSCDPVFDWLTDVHDSDMKHRKASELTIAIWTPDALVTRARDCSEIFPDYHRTAGESGSHEELHLMWQEEWFRPLTFFALALYLDLAGGNNYKAPETITRSLDYSSNQLQIPNCMTKILQHQLQISGGTSIK